MFVADAPASARQATREMCVQHSIFLGLICQFSRSPFVSKICSYGTNPETIILRLLAITNPAFCL